MRPYVYGFVFGFVLATAIGAVFYYDATHLSPDEILEVGFPW